MNQINTTSIKVLFTCLLLAFTVQCCAATTVSIADITADPGDVVTVPIMIDGIEDYGTATINLEYDSAVVFVEDVTGSSDSTITTKNIYNPDPGQAETEGTEGYARISAWNIDGVSDNIVFADVTIKVVGNSGGSTTLTLTVDTLQDTSYQEIPSVTISNGSITVSDAIPPTIAITSPTDGQTFTTPTITVSGTASDGVGLSKVEVKVGSGSWQTASGTTSWTASVTLASGSNTICRWLSAANTQKTLM